MITDDYFLNLLYITLIRMGSWLLLDPPTSFVVVSSMSLDTLVYTVPDEVLLVSTATGISTTLSQSSDFPLLAHNLLMSAEILLKVYVL